MKLGTIEIFPGKGAEQSLSASAEWDAMAVHGGELVFLSAVGSAADFKVMTAAVNSGGSIPCYWRAGGLKILKPSHSSHKYAYPRYPGTLNVSPQGYDVYKHRLGFGEEHRFYVSRRDGFMLVAGPEAIWRELKSDSYTTPLIREWLPYLANELRARSLLQECEVHPYAPAQEKAADEDEDDDKNPQSGSAPILNCGVVSCDTSTLDKIILDGLRNKTIFIPAPDKTEEEVDPETVRDDND